LKQMKSCHADPAVCMERKLVHLDILIAEKLRKSKLKYLRNAESIQ